MESIDYIVERICIKAYLYKAKTYIKSYIVMQKFVAKLILKS